jgi:aminodeoxyfutalosine deaminase
VIDSFVRAVPKVELHLHLVGAASPATVARLAAAHPEAGVPADPDALAALFAFRDFPHFLDVYAAVTALILTADDVAEVVGAAGADLAAQNVRYAEMTVTPYMHTVRGMAYEDLVAGLDAGRRRARAAGVELAWIYDIPGEHGQAGAAETLDRALDEPPDGLVGLGLAGAERGVDRADFAWAFDRARAAGLRSVPHARATGPPASGRRSASCAPTASATGPEPSRTRASSGTSSTTGSRWSCARRRTCAPGCSPTSPPTPSARSSRRAPSSPSTPTTRTCSGPR